MSPAPYTAADRQALREAQRALARETPASDALRALPGCAEVGLWLGRSLMLEARPAAALDAWLDALDAALAPGQAGVAAIDLEPAQARVAVALWLELAAAGREHGDAALALRLDQHADQLARVTGDATLRAHAALGIAADLYALGESPSATLALDQALAALPDAASGEARLNEQIARLQLAAERRAAAAAHYARAAQGYRDDGARIGELRCRLQLVELSGDAAARTRAGELATALARQPLDRTLHRQLAALFEAGGDLARAVEHLDAALAPLPPAPAQPNRRLNAVALRLELLVSEIELSQLRGRPDDDDACLDRAAFDARLPALIAAQRPLALLQIAVDRYAELRAQRAGPVGDGILAAVETLLRTERRDGELLARAGDDEFLLALPGYDTAGAERLAEQLRQQVERHDWTALHPTLAVSVSIGCAGCQPGDTAEVLLFRADLARYLARRSGGNRVSLAEEAPV
ncbi:diguanylate cyclase [Jeongeupia sp. USM3]|uniref:GGDEF domain-containing protein n=1 Tax=Jeongeupia sp. USM3 TaxID=1906741 RepID=UPI00089DE014|nr:GGDEF domain-containing protein [Jeongeupia sp. USM3]AOY00740.1 hypothetical protein BJP62_10005 [Jeongeupia sp. USM3]